MIDRRFQGNKNIVHYNQKFTITGVNWYIFHHTEDCQNTGVVELEDLFNNEWKEDLAKDSQWIDDNLIWEDKNGDVKSMSKRGNSIKLLPKETLVCMIFKLFILCYIMIFGAPRSW